MTTAAGGGPGETFNARVPEPAASRLRVLRDALLALRGVTERLVVDYEDPEGGLAFFVGPRQLCVVHVAEAGPSVTISLSRALTFEVIKAADMPERVRAVVDRTKEYGATRWVTLPLETPEDVEAFLVLARHKQGLLLPRGAEDLALPRDQTTLEKFA